MTPEELRARYEAYLSACNRHDLDDVLTHLAPSIVVNEENKTPGAYVEDLAALLRAFPDYHWTLVRAVVEDAWIAVHLKDRGTRRGSFLGAPGDGTEVSTDEFAIYHFDEQGRIEHIEVTADNARLIVDGR